MHSYRGFWLIFSERNHLHGFTDFRDTRVRSATQQQRLVESRRHHRQSSSAKRRHPLLRSDPPGDPYNEQQVQRDFQAILSLGFFDKTATRVLTEEGARGGVNVIFEVKELPIIRDLQFEGLKSVAGVRCA